MRLKASEATQSTPIRQVHYDDRRIPSNERSGTQAYTPILPSIIPIWKTRTLRPKIILHIRILRT